MAYWWVFQGDSYKRSREAGYLWAPKLGASKQTYEYWTNMERLRPGDIVFSGYKQHLVAISSVIAIAVDADPPDPKDLLKWPEKGWRVPITFHDLSPPIATMDFVTQILPLLQSKHAAFKQNGGGNLGYLYELPIAAGEVLVALIGRDHPNLLADSVGSPPPGSDGKSTTRSALIDARNGQGKFRSDLMGYWSNKCAVTECQRGELLRASHIRPWSASNDLERLDKFNGLLLSAAYDAAFDTRLISFSDDGAILIASDVPLIELQAVGIDTKAKLRRVDSRHLPYLKAHQELFSKRQLGLI